MDLFGLAMLLAVALGGIILIITVVTRGVFARDLALALQRVNQQEQALQDKASVLEQRLGQMERDDQAKLKRAHLEAEQIVHDAKNQAMNVRAVAIEEAKHRARQLLLEAEQGKAQLKAELADELTRHVMQRLCDSLRTLLPEAELASLHRALVGGLLASLTQLDGKALRATISRVEVTTAQEMEPAQTQQLRHWVVTALGSEMPLQVETDPTLVAGCVMRLGSTVVENSLLRRLSQANGAGPHGR